MKHQPRDQAAPIREYARRMRREQTNAEAALWSMLRGRSLKRWKFRRQHPVGYFILDFYCARLKLAIELDGAPHFEEGVATGDETRTAALNELGITVLRFENCNVVDNPIKTLGTLLEAIREIEESRSSQPLTPGPSPRTPRVG